MVKNLPANAGDVGSISGPEGSPGEGNGNPLLYSCLENPWTEEPDGLQPMGSQRVGCDLVTEKKQQHSTMCFGFLAHLILLVTL